MSELTVVIPVYNRRAVVGRAIESVLDQRMSDFELVVVDDGSDDGTLEHVQSYRDSRIRVVSQQNAGVCAARNAGIAASTGRYVLWLDSDDEAAPEWLSFHRSAFESGADLASSSARLLWPDGSEELVAPEPGDDAFGRVPALMLAGAVGIRRELLIEVGAFRDGLRFREHTDLALRLGGRMIADAFRTVTTEASLVTLHRQRRGYDPVIQYDSAMTLLRHDRQHLERSRRQLGTYYAIAGVAAGRLGRRSEARHLLAEAIRADPTFPKHYGRLARTMIARSSTSRP